MRKFILNKVVRSKLLDRMAEAGTEVESEERTGKDAVRLVLHKVIEEAQEAISVLDDSPGEITDEQAQKLTLELADTQTALKDSVALIGIGQAAVDKAEQRLAEERGRFIPTIYVKTVNVLDEDPMAQYYGSQPDRFTEIRE